MDKVCMCADVTNYSYLSAPCYGQIRIKYNYNYKLNDFAIYELAEDM